VNKVSGKTDIPLSSVIALDSLLNPRPLGPPVKSGNSSINNWHHCIHFQYFDFSASTKSLHRIN